MPKYHNFELNSELDRTYTYPRFRDTKKLVNLSTPARLHNLPFTFQLLNCMPITVLNSLYNFIL